MAIKSLDQLDMRDRRVLLRVDFNVPLENGVVADDTRIRASLPTIEYLLNEGATVLIISHLGRPGGSVVPEFSLAPVRSALETLLERPVGFATDTVGPEAGELVGNARPGDVILLENLRFNPGEQRNDDEFARQLASLADCYVNDAFGTAHRAHASTVGVAEYLPAAAGLLMRKEVEALGQVRDRPAQPLTLILGGAKVSDKIGVIRSFFSRARTILIGGGMANTFLLAAGHSVGRSLVEPGLTGLAAELVVEAKDSGVELVTPVDVVVAPSLNEHDAARTTPVGGVGEAEAIYDIGPETVELFAERIFGAATVVWNGPMGVFETPPFDAGTRGVAIAAADSSAYSLVGGGDSVAALNQAGLASNIDHISTGGGAALEYLEGTQLPGLTALEE